MHRTIVIPALRLPARTVPSRGAGHSVKNDPAPDFNKLCVMELANLSIGGLNRSTPYTTVSDFGHDCIRSDFRTLFIRLNDRTLHTSLMTASLRKYFGRRYRTAMTGNLLRRYLLENVHRIFGTSQLTSEDFPTVHDHRIRSVSEMETLLAQIDTAIKKKNPADWALKQELLPIVTIPKKRSRKSCTAPSPTSTISASPTPTSPLIPTTSDSSGPGVPPVMEECLVS